MSEHLSVNGKITYWHMPYDEEGAFTYCNHCKGTCERLTVEFHQGFGGDWMSVKCPECKKTIWSSKLRRKQIKDDKKCAICGNSTNHFDCEAYGGSCLNKKINYWCSKKCYKKSYKLEHKKIQDDTKEINT